MDLETVSHFATPNQGKSQNCAQSGSQEAPQIQPKITKNGHLGLSVSIGCPPGPQDHQNGAPGTPKGASKSPKSQFWVEKVTHCSSQPVSSYLLTRGRRQGAKPLNTPRQGPALPITACQTIHNVVPTSCQRSGEKRKERSA